MISKSYGFLKKIFYVILFSLILLSFYFLNNIFYYLVDGNITFEFLISNIFVIITYSLFALILFFFLMLLNSIEHNMFSKENIRYSQIIARVFIAITILEFLYINIKIDSTGIGLYFLDIDSIVVFSAFNYLVFSILTFIFKQLSCSNNINTEVDLMSKNDAVL